jgi:hypothetical protein
VNEQDHDDTALQTTIRERVAALKQQGRSLEEIVAAKA